MTRPCATILFVFALVAGLVWQPTAIRAQSLNFSGGEEPVEVYADNGIEWQQERLLFIARGNARAVRGPVTVFADELRAYYRQNEGNKTDIWRLDAIGKVRIKSPDGTAYGEHAVYNIDDGILVLTGGREVKLITPTDLITAEKQLEYWEKRQMAVARGNAMAKREGKFLNARVLAAYFERGANGENKLHRVEAFDDVKVTTPQETALSKRGVYNAESGIATLSGDVRILRGGNTLNGCSAEVNLNTGVSRLYGCKMDANGATNRVRGVLQPRKRSN
ncbi:MAG: LptA/OstA family protein [Rhodospirillaceae bacterium]